MSQILCRDVCLGYDSCTVSKHVNFSVEAGDYLCIVGDNGSGKSTLMRALLRLKAPHHGEILLGDGITRNDIGYLPQQIEAQKDFPASVFEIVISGCLGKKGFNPFYSRLDKQMALDYMKLLDIEGYADKSYKELSGGQQQRVLLARALCAAEKLILLDEPTSGLDPMVAQEFYSLIDNLNKSGITVIMVSHDIHAAVKYSKKILHIKKDGVFFGDVGEYLESAAYKKISGGRE